MVATPISWIMDEFKNVSWMEGISTLIHQFFLESYVNFETFVAYRFSKLLPTNTLLFKDCKYISHQKLTSLVQIMTLQNDFNEKVI
jgi:hypothetical protein